MFAVAAAMAASGVRPFVSTFASFAGGGSRIHESAFRDDPLGDERILARGLELTPRHWEGLSRTRANQRRQ
jgi:hypothetical protein